MPVPQLEAFDAERADASTVVITDAAALDALRAAAWEEGYQTGRDEARLQAASAEAESRAALASHLGQLTLTAAGAQREILSALEGPLLALTSCLLPVLARESLAPLLLEQISPLISEAAGQPLTLWLHPSGRARIGELLAASAPPELTICEDPALGPDDARFSIGGTGSGAELGLSRLCSEAARILQDFFTLSSALPEEHPHE